MKDSKKIFVVTFVLMTLISFCFYLKIPERSWHYKPTNKKLEVIEETDEQIGVVSKPETDYYSAFSKSSELIELR